MNILGAYLDGPFLLLYRAKTRGKKIYPLWFKSVRVNEEGNSLEQKNGADLDVKQLYKKQFKGKLISALPSKDFLTRPFDIPVPPGKHRQETLLFQIETLSPFKPGEMLHLPFIQEKQKDSLKGFLLSASKLDLQLHLDFLKKLKLEPDVTSCSASALCHFARFRFPSIRDFLIIDVGFSEISCTLMKDQTLSRSHSTAYGMKHLLEALYEDRKRILLKKEIESAAKQMDLLLLKPHLNPRLFEKIEQMRYELERVYYAFSKEEEIPILYTGKVDAFIHLKEILLKPTLQTDILSPEEARFAIPFGLCLEEASSSTIQFRREEFFPQKAWSRMGKQAFFLLLLSFVLSGGIFFFSFWFKKSREETIQKALFSCPVPPEYQEGGDLGTQIDVWIEHMDSADQNLALFKEAPKVTKLLDWLSSHPLLQELKKEEDPINIQQIRTKLESFPSLDHPEDSYQMQVELEFSCQNILNARKFHEFLREKDPFVDADKEVLWDVLEDSYRVMFYVKNGEGHVF